MKKADLGKYGGPIIEFISGSLLSAATTVGFLTKSILPFVIIAGITGLLLAFTPLIIIGIKALIRRKELVVKATKEDEEKYRTPFPEIDQNPGQSAVIQMLFEAVTNNYNASPLINVDENGKLWMEAAVKVGKEGTEEEFKFIRISELYLTPAAMEIDTLDWQVSSAAIVEKFEEDCKSVLGDYKK